VPPPTTLRPGGYVDAHQGGTSSGPPQPWEFEALRLIAEQGAIPFDQLARFLGATDRQARVVAKHLTDRGFADYGAILHGEPHWLWLTWRGSRASGTGFRALSPRVGALARIRAVNEIRLHIRDRAPQAHWVCGRTVFREQGRRGHRPNAVVEIGAERHALIVRLQAAEPERTRALIESQVRRYDALIVFANASPRRRLESLAGQHHWPRLVIRDIPRGTT
jgi:hypothetical protein